MYNIRVIIFTLGMFLIFGIVSQTYAWIDGTPLLYEEGRSLLYSVGQIKPTLAPRLDEVKLLPAFDIGETKKFYAIDMRKNSQYSLNSTCYAISDKAYVFVENGITVDQNRINSFLESFNLIYDRIVELYGPPPTTINSDPRIYLLITNIPGSVQANGARLVGYFNPIDQFLNAQIFNMTRKRSNEANMLYIDSISLSLKDIGIESVVAHEFTHLIQWARDPDEDIWVNEGTAVYTESILGYSTKDRIRDFQNNPNISLLIWNGRIENYGAAYLFFAYIAEKYGGVNAIASIVKNQSQSTKGIEQGLAQIGKSASFDKIFLAWVIANYIDKPDLEDGKYGYATLDIQLNPSITETLYPINKKALNVLPWSAQYIEFKKNPDEILRLTIYDDNKKSINAQAIEIDVNGEITVLSVKSSEMESGLISVSKDEIKVILVITSQPNPFNQNNVNSPYNYSAELLSATAVISPSTDKIITTWGKIKS